MRGPWDSRSFTLNLILLTTRTPMATIRWLRTRRSVDKPVQLKPTTSGDLRNTEEALLQSFFMLAVRTDGEIVVVAFGANEPIMEGSELARVVIFLSPL